MKHRSVMFSVLCRIVFLSWFMSAFAARGAVVPQLKLTLPSTLTVSEDATSSLEMIVSDPTGSLQDLLLSAASSDQSVLPASGIVASGVGMRRQLVLSPLKPGTTLLTVTIRDAATHSVVQTCPVTVKPRIPQGLIMDHGENLARQLYLSAVVSELPQPQIRLVFSADAKAHKYTVYRRGKNVKAWGAPIAHLPGSATEFVDQNISAGEPYEFRVDKDSTNPVKWSAYLYAGVRTSLAEARGKIALVVDNTYAADLKPELDRLTQGLVGDGWQVLRHDVSRDSTTTFVKGLLKADYAADPGQVKAVFLFGHVPIAYSGFSIPDGHFSRRSPPMASTEIWKGYGKTTFRSFIRPILQKRAIILMMETMMRIFFQQTSSLRLGVWISIICQLFCRRPKKTS